MTPAEFLRELSYPLRSGAVSLAIATFFLLSMVIVAAYNLAGVYALSALWLGLVIVVATVRYLVMLAEARADGVAVQPPGIEYFTLTENTWSLFPAAVLLAVASLVDMLLGDGRPTAARAVIVVAAALFPAVIGVLTLTRSMLESVNPLSIVRYIRRMGASYLYALAAVALPICVILSVGGLPPWLALLATFYSLASLFSVVGGLSRSSGLADEIGIPEAELPDEAEVGAQLEKVRRAALSHAYSFASRGNRDGALAHIESALAADPDPDDAWRWYLDGMLTWEDANPALLFGQRVLHRLLRADQLVQAVKLMMRCQLVNPRFRPLPEDMERAVSAAEALGNEQLAESLRRL